MTAIPEVPRGEDLAALREEIDELKAVPEDELISPNLGELVTGHTELEPEPTDALGTEQWDKPVEEESLDQQ